MQMSGTAPITTQHHIPEHLKLQQHQYRESQMTQTATGKTEDLKYQKIYLNQVLPCTREILYWSLKIKCLQTVIYIWYNLTSPNAIANYVSTDSINLIRVQTMICD